MVRMRYHEPKTVDADDYDAEFVRTEQTKTKHGEAINWYFIIKNDPDFEDERVSGMTDVKITPANKTGRWLKAVGADLETLREDDQLEADDFAGAQVRITIENSQDGDAVFSNVTNVISTGRRSSRRSKDRDDDRDSSKPSERSSKRESKDRRDDRRDDKDTNRDDRDDESRSSGGEDDLPF